MIYLFSYILISAVWHFVYEGVLAPGARLHIRNELFALRDELRNLKIQKKISERDERAFQFVHEGINIFLRKLPELNLTNHMHASKEIRGNNQLKKQLDGRLTLITSCENSDIKEVFQRSLGVVTKAFLVNSGGLIIYIVPVILCAVFFSNFKKLVSELLVAPRAISDRLIPENSIAVAN